MPESVIALIAGLPLLAALLGYTLRRSALAGWLGIGALLISAVVCLLLLGPGPSQFSFGSIHLPESQLMPAAGVRELQSYPRDFEQRGQVIQMLQESGRQGAPAVDLPLALIVDPQRLIFGATCAFIAALCLFFSLRERAGDPRRGYFFGTLTLFSAAMLLLVTADTLLLVFVAWELMSLCSFLLIGYSGTERARLAARQAFWTTRVTDFGLLFAVMILGSRFGYYSFSNIDMAGLFSIAGHLQSGRALDPELSEILGWLTAAALLVTLAALGKLAAFPLSFWLADAMVAPAQVSALLHAATMVAAGPFLMLQFISLFAVSEVAMLTAVLGGGLTLVLAGLMALCATDAKRVLAFSTMSQLAIPIIAVGSFAQAAGAFHLLAHAWFKAPLFLAVGYLAATVTKHALTPANESRHADPTDPDRDHTLLARLAGSARRNPLALTALILGGLSLAGMTYSAGFFGKEQLLLALSTRAATNLPDGGIYPLASAGWRIGAVLLLLSIPITAAYTVRLIGVLGWGATGSAATLDGQSEEAGRSAGPTRGWTLPLALTALAAFVGSIGLAIAYQLEPFQALVGSGQEIKPDKLMLAADVLLVLAGGALAWAFNVASPATGALLVREGRLQPLIAFFDAAMETRRFWHAAVGNAGALLALRFDRTDRRVIDRMFLGLGRDGRLLARAANWVELHIVDGLRYWACEVWWILLAAHRRFFQTGQIQHYMLIILISAVVMCFIILPPMVRAFGDILFRQGQ